MSRNTAKRLKQTGINYLTLANMEDYTQLKQALITSGQTAAYSNQIVKSIDEECLFETLAEQPIDEAIVVAYLDSENIEQYNDIINRAIARLKKAII